MVQMAKSSPMKNSSKPHARKVSTSQPNTKKAGRKNTERVNSDRKTESKDDEDFEMEAEEEEEEVVATTKQGELQRECKLCSKIYSSVYLLRRHVENVHAETKPRPFRCELCDYAATNKWNIKEHYRSHTVDNFMDFSDEDVPNESQEKDEDSDFEMSASEEEEDSGSDWEEEIKSVTTGKSKPQGSRRSSCTVGKRKRYMDSDKDLESSEDDYVPYNYVACKRVPKTKRPKKASVLEEEDEELEEEEEELTPKKKLGRGKAEKEEESSDEDDVDGDDGDGDKSSGKGRDKVEKVRQLKSKHRPPCMCGKKCYRKDPFHCAIFHMNFRKNPEHFAEFSHQGDVSYDQQSELEDDNIPDCWVRMTRIQESPLLATSIQYQRRTLHRKCKIMGGDTESESVPLKDSTTQTDVNSTAARVGTETLNLNQTPDEFNSVCVKIDTDEWDNMATDFYSKCAKSEQVLREEMHQDNNKLNGFNLVHEQSEKTGCLEMVQDSTRQDGFPSACVDSEQMGCDVTHQDVTRQAGFNSECVHSKQIDDSNAYTAENGLHSAGVKTKMDHDCNLKVPRNSNYEKDESGNLMF
ncbi:hypothetical protein DPMN_126354 [Dreissena polymorpha]|uniref:C2H2-type domain-containing protein n=1 Tax=Dreissena polymorpha TaxID=45954 RepID=A0A9D4GX57_DREPO|nr:hypothetical protein DPMN_126354 [Dreissena polymorpha]